jgi:hypothetical protein
MVKLKIICDKKRISLLKSHLRKSEESKTRQSTSGLFLIKKGLTNPKLSAIMLLHGKIADKGAGYGIYKKAYRKYNTRYCRNVSGSVDNRTASGR